MDVIVVGVDGSAGSREALAFAAEEARIHRATLRVVAAWTVPVDAFVPAGAVHGAVHAGAARRVAETCVADADLPPEIDVEVVAREGRAAEVLVEESELADLLVVGSRGRGGFQGLLLGSVGQECVQHARCPIVIVPGRR